MLIPNYDRGKHFTDVIQRTIKEYYSDPALEFRVLDGGVTRIVKWETNSGYHLHIVRSLDKEDLFELLNKIQETL